MNAAGVGILLYFLVGVVEGLPDLAPLAAAVDVGSRGEEFRLTGIALVAFGGLVQLVAFGRFVQYQGVLRRGEATSSAGVYVLLTFGLLLFGLAYIGYVVISG